MTEEEKALHASIAQWRNQWAVNRIDATRLLLNYILTVLIQDLKDAIEK